MTTKYWLDISMLEGRRRPGGRNRRTERSPMRTKALKMSRLRGNNTSKVVQCLSLLLLIFVK
jgi:hypothetical protein